MKSRRQALLALATGTLAASFASLAQQPRTFRIGFLSSEAASDPSQAARLEALRAALRERGYAEGRNIVIDARWAEGKYDRLPAMASELVALQVAAIVASGTKALVAAKNVTSTVPIIMGSSGDAVALGVTANLARPSGNVTGWTFFGTEVATKLVELVKEAAPRTTRLAYLINPAETNYAIEAIQRAAASLRVEVVVLEARAPGELDRAFAQMTADRCDAVLVQAGSMFAVNTRTAAELALKHRLPSASALYDFAEAGGLITYGPDRLEGYRRAAVFVDRILKGAKPADLPIEQASTFELVVNMRTARSLGLSIPQPLQVRARLI
jgi:putative ABC transport system substrate-binding protein